MTIPDLIRVVRRGELAHVYIDGRELAGSIPRGTDIIAAVNPDELPTVTVTLMARRVDVVNDLEEGGDGDGPEQDVGADQRDGPSA